MEKMTLREVCSHTGATRRAVQGYEKAGLVSPVGKNKYGYLLYDDECCKRISRILFLQEIGFSIKQITEIIDAPCEVQKSALTAQVQNLETYRAHLAELIEQVNNCIAKL